MALKKKEKNKRLHEVTVKDENNSDPIAELTGNDSHYWDDVLQMLLSEKEHILYQAIRMLPKDKWSNAIMWRYFDKLETAEIAARLGVSMGDVYNTLSNAKEALKQILKHKI